jgi:hypothetical protein
MVLSAVKARPMASARRFRAGAVWLSAIGAVASIYLVKVAQDEERASYRVMESFYRTHDETCEEFYGNFGHLGWKLFPYFIAHEGTDEQYRNCTTCFLSYQRPWPGQVFIGEEWRKTPSARSYEVVESGEVSIGWRSVPYVVGHAPNSPPKNRSSFVLPSDFEPPCAPLDDEEWRTYIETGGARCVN